MSMCELYEWTVSSVDWLWVVQHEWENLFAERLRAVQITVNCTERQNCTDYCELYRNTESCTDWVVQKDWEWQLYRLLWVVWLRLVQDDCWLCGMAKWIDVEVVQNNRVGFEWVQLQVVQNDCVVHNDCDSKTDILKWLQVVQNDCVLYKMTATCMEWLCVLQNDLERVVHRHCILPGFVVVCNPFTPISTPSVLSLFLFKF